MACFFSVLRHLKMTAEINFTDLKQKMALLKELNIDSEKHEFTNAQRDRYIALRREVARKLLPLFEDLQETKMLQYWFRKQDAPTLKEATRALEEDGIDSTMGDLGGPFENSGITLSIVD